mgnify:CR=1 FL=1
MCLLSAPLLSSHVQQGRASLPVAPRLLPDAGQRPRCLAHDTRKPRGLGVGDKDEMMQVRAACVVVVGPISIIPLDVAHLAVFVHARDGTPAVRIPILRHAIVWTRQAPAYV